MDTIHSDIFPDGTPVDGWFHNTSIPELTELGKQYIITDYGIHDDGRIYTDNFQKLIDLVYNAGGGVIVIPRGTYMTGALFFRQGVNLYIEDGATLMGSDNISDYPVCETRIEGETCQYFAALINVSGIDGIPAALIKTNSGQGLSIWLVVPMLLLLDCTFVIRSSGLITFTNVLMYVTLTAALQAHLCLSKRLALTQ